MVAYSEGKEKAIISMSIFPGLVNGTDNWFSIYSDRFYEMM